jgi:hypothetical protein
MKKLWVVTCNRCGRESSPVDGKARVAQAREMIGWRFFWGNDYCPRCFGQFVQKKYPNLTASPTP